MAKKILLLVLCLFSASSALAGESSPAVVDPPADARHPAAMDAFVVPVGDGALNAVIYLASGAAAHPTLLMLHGFPGNEQNLDLAQAARRAGWNVLTFHYRGSWGSAGAFSFAAAAEDAHAALAYLERPEVVSKHRIDPTHIALLGHSMGGFMAADAAADDKSVVGLFLLDAWDMTTAPAELATEDGRKDWHEEFLSDLPPLAGTSEAALTQELIAGAHRFSVNARIAAYGNRPLAVYGASRGNGAPSTGYMRTAREAGNTQVTGAVWDTDHPFSDRRIALSKVLVEWLRGLASRGVGTK